MLKDFAPGAQLPVLLYNGDPKTDTVNIEDFLEDRLAPPHVSVQHCPRKGKRLKCGGGG